MRFALAAVVICMAATKVLAGEVVHVELGPSINFSEPTETGTCHDNGTIWQANKDIELLPDEGGNGIGHWEQQFDATYASRTLGIIVQVDALRAMDDGKLYLDFTVRNAVDRYTVFFQRLVYGSDQLVGLPSLIVAGFLNSNRPCPDGAGLQILGLSTRQ